MSGAKLLVARTNTAELDAWCEVAVPGLSLAGRGRSQWARCPGRGWWQLALMLLSLMPGVRLLPRAVPGRPRKEPVGQMSGERLLAARTDTAEPDAWCEASVPGLSLPGRRRSQWARYPGRGCWQLAWTLLSLMPGVKLLSLGCPWQAEEGARGPHVWGEAAGSSH